jgi:hypothetical protein
METREQASFGSFVKALDGLGWKMVNKAIFGGPSYRFWDHKDCHTDIWLRRIHGEPDNGILSIEKNDSKYKVELRLKDYDLVTFPEGDSVMLCEGDKTIFSAYNFDKEPTPTPEQEEE